MAASIDSSCRETPTLLLAASWFTGPRYSTWCAGRHGAPDSAKVGDRGPQVRCRIPDWGLRCLGVPKDANEGILSKIVSYVRITSEHPSQSSRLSEMVGVEALEPLVDRFDIRLSHRATRLARSDSATHTSTDFTAPNSVPWLETQHTSTSAAPALRPNSTARPRRSVATECRDRRARRSSLQR